MAPSLRFSNQDADHQSSTGIAPRMRWCKSWLERSLQSRDRSRRSCIQVTPRPSEPESPLVTTCRTAVPPQLDAWSSVRARLWTESPIRITIESVCEIARCLTTSGRTVQANRPTAPTRRPVVRKRGRLILQSRRQPPAIRVGLSSQTLNDSYAAGQSTWSVGLVQLSAAAGRGGVTVDVTDDVKDHIGHPARSVAQ